MNKELKFALIIVLIMIIAFAAFGVYGMYAGNPRMEGLHISHITVADDHVDLRGSSASSADNYKNYQYSIKGENLYITINYALKTRTHFGGDFIIIIKDDFSKVKRVYLIGGGDKKQIWEASEPVTPAAITEGAIAPAMQAKALTLLADQIMSGKIVEGMVGGTLEYQMTSDELSAFITYYNGRNFTENDKINDPSDHDSLSDSTDVVLQLTDDPENCIVIMGFLDGETMVGFPDGEMYVLRDQELTDYLNITMAKILKEKGQF